MFVKVKRLSQSELFAVAHYSPVVASCGTDELIPLAKRQFWLVFTHNSISSDCFRWDISTSELGEKKSEEAFVSQAARLLCAASRWHGVPRMCRFQMWRMATMKNCYKLVIETTFHSVETPSIFFYFCFKQVIISRSEGWSKSLWCVRATLQACVAFDHTVIDSSDDWLHSLRLLTSLNQCISHCKSCARYVVLLLSCWNADFWLKQLLRGLT